MGTGLRGLWAGVLAAGLGLASLAEAGCRQALALGLDVSASVDAREDALQREGLAKALLSPPVVDAFETMPDIPVALMIYEWSGYRSQSVLQPWITVRSRADLVAVATQLRAAPVGRSGNSTALGGAALFAAKAFERGPDCWRRTLDLSGDGKNNDGPTPQMLADDPRLDGITINGLVIGADPGARGAQKNAHIGELVAYFQQNVIRGAGAFTEVALGFEGFEEAMRRKLLREIRVPMFSALYHGAR
ncbi:DUF1194 domain-containing protein [Dinoroseobacter sp. S375]|uniref:DUF1194 domain-containing protein n=1 Tax=Dinoroseobacter sp. S375 TaxID=3415136 RepID=UPI003C7A696B